MPMAYDIHYMISPFTKPRLMARVHPTGDPSMLTHNRGTKKHQLSPSIHEKISCPGLNIPHHSSTAMLAKLVLDK